MQVAQSKTPAASGIASINLLSISELGLRLKQHKGYSNDLAKLSSKVHCQVCIDHILKVACNITIKQCHYRKRVVIYQYRHVAKYNTVTCNTAVFNTDILHISKKRR